MRGAGWLGLLEAELCSFVLVVARCVGAARRHHLIVLGMPPSSLPAPSAGSQA
jgi:hypothetical protein